jgi:hypothetical protein
MDAFEVAVPGNKDKIRCGASFNVKIMLKDQYGNIITEPSEEEQEYLAEHIPRVVVVCVQSFDNYEYELLSCYGYIVSRYD